MSHRRRIATGPLTLLHLRVRRLLHLLLPLTLAALARGQLIMNGGFETNNLNGAEGSRLLDSGDSTTISGWTIINDGSGERPFLMRSGGSMSDPYPIGEGTFTLALNIGSGVSTSLNVTAGYSYTVTFLAERDSTNADFRVSLDGDDHFITVTNDYSVGTPNNFGTYQTTFVAASTGVASLVFFNPSTGADYKQYYLDGVSVTSIPEPATVALLTSLSALALVTLRRQRSR